MSFLSVCDRDDHTHFLWNMGIEIQTLVGMTWMSYVVYGEFIGII